MKIIRTYSIGMDVALNVVLVANSQSSEQRSEETRATQSVRRYWNHFQRELHDLRIDGGWSRSPIFVQLQSSATSLDLIFETFHCSIVTFTSEAEVERNVVGGSEHCTNVALA